MNIETLAVILGIAFIAAIIARFVSGWTFSGWLVSFLLACFGAVGGWYAQQQLRLPPLYGVPFNNVVVPVVWPALAALVLALFGGVARRRSPRVRRRPR
jgi:hypothetical protein